MPGLNDISVNSKGRRKQEFVITQEKTGGYLWIDGRKICKTKKGTTYFFHIVGKKIDHFFAYPSGAFGIIPTPEVCEYCE